LVKIGENPVKKQTALFVLIANAALVAAGCAKAPGLPMTAGARAKAAVPTIMTKSGKEFSLGFDDNRYKQVAKKAKVRKMPRQALLPTRVDLRDQCSPVGNQGKMGSCTAWSVGKGFREFQINKRNERKVPLSAMFIYYEARAAWGNTQEPTGSTIYDNMVVLEEKGICTDESFPYDVTKYMIKPTTAMYQEAKECTSSGASHISTLDDMQSALAQGEVVRFAFDVMESFRTVGTDGMMPVPKAGEKRLGGHAVMAVGYDSQKQVVIVRNSWGTDWADKGYFYMPYEVVRTKGRDMWTAATPARD